MVRIICLMTLITISGLARETLAYSLEDLMAMYENNGDSETSSTPSSNPSHFNFNNNGSSQDGATVPTIKIPLGDIVNQYLSTVAVQNCHPNYCEVSNPCHSDEKCLSYGCNMTRCGESKVEDSTMQPHHCMDENITCTDFTYCMELLSCTCQPGWTGTYCNTPCDKPCVEGHGLCQTSSDDTHIYCNCEHAWEGEFCENLKPDPRALAVKAQEQELHARVMAGVLTACVAVVLLLAIIVPVVLWRLRVIFVLKLVYYFKEYEDLDGKQYDAYVSMTPTPSAEKFVFNELRPVLEDLGFKLYIQARDSPSNEALSDIILSALEKSRRTIMVVTSDYLSNEWNRFEYLIAQHETLKLKQRIIPIILEDIDKEQVKLDKSLKYILESVKCLNHPRLKQRTDAQRPELGQPSAKNDKDIWRTEMSEKCFKSSISQENVEYEKKEKKFWKLLELNMPKKKKQNKKKANKKTVGNPKVESKFIEKFSAKGNLSTKEDTDVITTGFKMNNLNEISGMPRSDLENKFLNILNAEPCVTDPSTSSPGPRTTEMESTSRPQSTEMESGYYNTSHSIDF